MTKRKYDTFTAAEKGPDWLATSSCLDTSVDEIDSICTHEATPDDTPSARNQQGPPSSAETVTNWSQAGWAEPRQPISEPITEVVNGEPCTRAAGEWIDQGNRALADVAWPTEGGDLGGRGPTGRGGHYHGRRGRMVLGSIGQFEV